MAGLAGLGWEAEGSQFQPWCGENLQGVPVVGEITRAPSKQYWGTPEQGTDSLYAHIGPAFAHMQLG